MDLNAYTDRTNRINVGIYKTPFDHTNSLPENSSPYNVVNIKFVLKVRKESGTLNEKREVRVGLMVSQVE